VDEVKSGYMRIGIDASRTFEENPTGTERYAYEITTRLLNLPEARGHEWILYTKHKIQTSKFKFPSNVRTQVVPLKYLWTQAGLAARTWVDGLDALWVPAHTLPVFRKPGVKTAVTIHGIEYEWLPAFENPLQRWYLPLSTEYAAKTASKVISVSKFTKEELVRRMGVDPEKIEVVWEGMSEDAKVGEKEVRNVLEKYGLERGNYLLFVGTVQPRKNLERLIEAYGKLSSERLKLVIAGKLGWGYDQVVKLAGQLAGKVVLTGYIEDKERVILLKSAGIYVQPSITEGFGLPVLEAMAAGIPVVSSEGGALKEVLEIPGTGGKYAGVLFDPTDTDDMTDKIKLVVGDERLKKSLVDRGLRRAGDFSWDKAARETYNILVNL